MDRQTDWQTDAWHTWHRRIGRSTLQPLGRAVGVRPTTSGRAATKWDGSREERPNEEEELLRRWRQPREELVEAMTCIALKAKRSGSGETELQAMLYVKVGAIGEGLPPPMSSNGRLRHTCQLHRSSAAATKGVTRVVVWRLVEVVADPAAEAAGERHVGQGSGWGSGVEEEREARLTKMGGYQGGVSGECQHGTESIIPADDGDGGGDERSLAERNREVDSPMGDGDMLSEQAWAGVLLDTEKAVEGEQARAPIPGIGESGKVKVRVDSEKSLWGDGLRGLVEVGVAVPVG
jgi:hypothetical protein